MSVAGDTDATLQIRLTDSQSGAILSYANKTAFQAAGWNLVFLQGTTVITPAWAIVHVADGWHVVTYTVPSGDWWVRVTEPTGLQADPPAYRGPGSTYDTDALAALFLTNQGTPGVQSAADGTLGDIVMGDSWDSGTLYVPVGKMTPLGQNDLAGLTYTAAFKRTPADSPVTAIVTLVDSATRALKVSWDTFPSGLNLGATASDTSQVWYLDVQLRKAGPPVKIITPLRYQVTVVWQRDTST